MPLEECGLHRVPDSTPGSIGITLHPQAINHQQHLTELAGGGELFLPLHKIIDPLHLVPYQHTRVAVCPQDGEVVHRRPIVRDEERGADHIGRALAEGLDKVNHVLRRLTLHLLSANGAEGVAHSGEEHPQVVVDLRRRADGGAGGPIGDPLLDCDGRRDAEDIVHLRLGHLGDKLSGVDTQALDVAPLPLSIEGVEGERTLSRATQTGEYGVVVSRDREGDILQIIDPDAVRHDILLGVGGVCLRVW